MNFRDDALRFVHDNSCANSAPLELIEKAMKYGALAAVEVALIKTKDAVDRVAERRRKSECGARSTESETKFAAMMKLLRQGPNQLPLK